MNEIPSFEDSYESNTFIEDSNGTKYLRLRIVRNETPSFEDSWERNTFVRE